MQSQDKLDIHTFFDVYLDDGDKRHFCKRYERETTAHNLCRWLDLRYKHLGYAGQIQTVEIGPEGLGHKNGGHAAGTPPQEQGNPPTERRNPASGGHAVGTPPQEQGNPPTE